MALRITNLSKTYTNEVRALQDLTLTLGNKMFGLLGPNGAANSRSGDHRNSAGAWFRRDLVQ